jgi:hypothetical protein
MRCQSDPPEQEMCIASEPVEFRDHQRRPPQAAFGQCLGEFWPIAVIAALDLDELRQWCRAESREIGPDRGPLTLDAEPRTALPFGGNPEIGNEAVAHDPALQGLDRVGRVIYLGTFSKLPFPSLRLGDAVLPDDLVQPFAAARYLADRHSSGLLQVMVTEFILDGHFARHLKRMRAHYRERQEFLIDLFARRLRGVLEIPAVESGMYLAASLPPHWSDRATAAALFDAEIVAVPLSALTLATPRRPGLILGYAGHGEAALARAVERMAAVFDRQIGQTGMMKSTELELSGDQSRR